MPRWDPDARERLERAALELFLEQGFDDTTVPQITARAGLTTRTFFRHFADKREVLFAGEDDIPLLASRFVREAPPDLAPAEVMAAGMHRFVRTVFAGRLDHLRRMRVVIDGNDGLLERELRKRAALVDAIAAAFRSRGVHEVTAGVVAEVSVGLVTVVLRRWLESGEDNVDVALAETTVAFATAFGSSTF